MWKRYLLTILAAVVFTHSPAMDIVIDGKPVADIVLPDEANPLIDYAAKELQSHVEKATGAKLRIFRESTGRDADGKSSIFLGSTQAAEKAGLGVSTLPANAFRIVATDNALFLAGKDGIGDPLTNSRLSMGSLFAVYRWLDEQLGVRWLWPGKSGTVIPETKAISVSSGERTVMPWSMHSRIRPGAFSEGASPEARATYLSLVNTWFLRQLINQPVSFQYGHAYREYWNRFGEQHPEYFALRPDGGRGPIDERTYLAQMCVSNPGLQAQVIEDWLSQKEISPDRPWVNGIENDRRSADPFCQCEVCLAWDAPAPGAGEKSYSDRYARFWLSLQEAARKHVERPKVIGYAYTGYAEPPRQTRLNSDIIVGVVPSFYYPLDSERQDEFRRQWQGWHDVGAELYLRPNYFLYGYAMPYIFARQFGEDFKFARRNGMVATDFDSLTGMWGVQGPNLYMLGRLHSNPDLEVDTVLNEYFSGFGTAADAVREYFEYWEEVTKGFGNNFEKEVGGGWGFVSKFGEVVYTPEAFGKGRAILDKAIVSVESDAPSAERVRILDVWLKHAELCMEALRAYRARGEGRADPELNRKIAEAREAVDKFREEHREEFSAANMPFTERLEVWSGWRPNR